MTTNQDQDRAEFEAYLRTEGYGGYTIKLFRSGNMPPDIRERWEGWQAARRAPSTPSVQHDHGEFIQHVCQHCGSGVKITVPSTPAVPHNKHCGCPTCCAGNAQAGKEWYSRMAAKEIEADCNIEAGRKAAADGTRYQVREIGEGDWEDASKERYEYCQTRPEMDTRIVAAADGAGELPPLDDSFLDYHLNLILIASGSALRHYSMHKTKEDMRIALRETIKAAWRMK